MNSKKKKEPSIPTIAEFISIASYDDYGAGYIWGIDKNGGKQMIAEIRGWGAIWQIFKTVKETEDFQNKLGKFIADAINEKIKTNLCKTKK